MYKLFGFAVLILLPAVISGQIRQPLPGTHKTEIVLERNGVNGWRTVDSRLVLDQGDRVRFRIRSSSGGYLYVTNRNTSGGYDILFPGPDTGSQNKLEPNREYIVPANHGWFQIAAPPGQEITYWLLSPIQISGLDRRVEPQPETELSQPPLLPRCDAAILRARGECIDTSAGPRELSSTAALPRELAAVRNLTSRDLVFIRQKDLSIVSSFVPLNGPVIYEFRLAHR